MKDLDHRLVLSWHPLGQVYHADVDASSRTDAKSDHDTHERPVVAYKEDSGEYEALEEAGGKEQPAAAHLIRHAWDDQKGQTPRKVENRSEEASLPIRLTHEVELLDPVVQ